MAVGHNDVSLSLFCRAESRQGMGRWGGTATHRLTFRPARQNLLTKERLPPEATEPLLVQVRRVKGPDAHVYGLACVLCTVWREEGDGFSGCVRRLAGGVLDGVLL